MAEPSYTAERADALDTQSTLIASRAEKLLGELLEKQLKTMADQKGEPKIESIPAAIKWLDALLPTIITVATFGGSITFSLIPSASQSATSPSAPSSTAPSSTASFQPAPSSTFDAEAITRYLALAWLFFLIALGVACIASLVLAFQRENMINLIQDHEKAKQGKSEKKLSSWKTFLAYFINWVPSLVLQIAVLLAFFFLGLVVVAYSKAIGYIAVAMTATCIIIAVILIIVENLGCFRRRKEADEARGEPLLAVQNNG